MACYLSITTSQVLLCLVKYRFVNKKWEFLSGVGSSIATSECPSKFEFKLELLDQFHGAQKRGGRNRKALVWILVAALWMNSLSKQGWYGVYPRVQRVIYSLW